MNLTNNSFSFDTISLETLFYLVALVLLFILLYFFLSKMSKGIGRSFAVFTSLTQLAYIVWRIGFTLPIFSVVGMIVGVILVGMETLGFFQSLTYHLLFIKKPLSETKRIETLDRYPMVDIMIPTYNEPVRIIKRTVAGASMMKYPKDKLNIYVCDDGSRKEVKQICEAYGAHWVTRRRHDNAKAGNLNHCYKTRARGEFSVILDADMVPRNDFLEKTLGYFEDPTIAFVQTPQVFFNPDVFQRNLGLEDDIPNEQDFFMEEIQRQREAFDALLFVGSGCVFRRSHLKSIGYIPVGTITEDMATSLLLQDKGYHGVLVTDTFAQGLSAETFADHMVQRMRWCQGNLQVLKRYNPWKMKGLSFMQKEIITDGGIYWLFGLKKMIFTLAPIFFILTGIPVLKADIIWIFLLWLPSFVASMLSMRLFSHKNRSWGWAHIYEMSLGPALAWAALLEMFSFGDKKFAVTPKGVPHNKTHFAFNLALPHLVLAGLSIASLVLIGLRFKTAGPAMMIVYGINAFWILYNLYAIIVSILLCFEKPRVRQYDRLAVNRSIGIRYNGVYTIGSLINISEGGCNISPFDDKMAPTLEGVKRISLTINGAEISGTILGYIRHTKSFAIQFDPMSAEDYARLVDFIFSGKDEGYGEMKDKFVAGALIRNVYLNLKRDGEKKKYIKQLAEGAASAADVENAPKDTVDISIKKNGTA